MSKLESMRRWEKLLTVSRWTKIRSENATRDVVWTFSLRRGLFVDLMARRDYRSSWVSSSTRTLLSEVKRLPQQEAACREQNVVGSLWKSSGLCPPSFTSTHPAAACRRPPVSTQRRALRLMRLIARTTHERTTHRLPAAARRRTADLLSLRRHFASPARTKKVRVTFCARRVSRHAEERSRPSLHLQASEGERTSLDGSLMHSPGRTAAGLPCVKTNPHFISACPSCSDSVYNEGSHYTHTVSAGFHVVFSQLCKSTLRRLWLRCSALPLNVDGLIPCC